MPADKVPQPVIAAQSVTVTIRQAVEECQNVLDAAGPKATVITEAPVSLPDGTSGVLRCSRDKHGFPRITISILAGAAK
jgi:hypothetical protein